jgi:hypothetical protein
VGLRDGAANGVNVDGATVRPGKTNKVSVDVSNGTAVAGQGEGGGGQGLGHDEGLGEGPGVRRDVCGTASWLVEPLDQISNPIETEPTKSSGRNTGYTTYLSKRW